MTPNTATGTAVLLTSAIRLALDHLRGSRDPEAQAAAGILTTALNHTPHRTGPRQFDRYPPIKSRL